LALWILATIVCKDTSLTSSASSWLFHGQQGRLGDLLQVGQLPVMYNRSNVLPYILFLVGLNKFVDSLQEMHLAKVLSREVHSIVSFLELEGIEGFKCPTIVDPQFISGLL